MQPTRARPATQDVVSDADLLRICQKFNPGQDLDLAKAVRAEVLSKLRAPVAYGWQPIASAPKDGTRVDLWRVSTVFGLQEDRLTDCWFSEGGWRRDEGKYGNPTVSGKVTHWMPVAVAPGSASAPIADEPTKPRAPMLRIAGVREDVLRRAALASAPVAGEARPVGTLLNHHGEILWHRKPDYFPADFYAAPQASEAVRDALWTLTEHNALHFGEQHSTVIQGRAALSAQPSGNSGELSAQPGAQKEQP